MALLLAVGFISGCAQKRVPIKNDSVLEEKEGLMADFNQYWSLVARKEVEKTFAREAPYVQEMISESSYRLYMKLLYKSELQGVEVLGVSCEQPFFCCIDCRLTFLSQERTVRRNRRDCWVRVQSKWYHVLKNPIVFPQLGNLQAAKHRLYAVK